MRPLLLGWLLLATAAPAAEPPIPNSPEALVCPAGTERHEDPLSERRGGIRVQCLRPDGFRLGQQAAWYSDGQIAEYEWVVEAGERTANDGLEVRWQPDGRLFSIALNRNAAYHGPQVTWSTDGLPLTRLYDEGSLVNLYRGTRPPEFRCPDGLRARLVREERDHYSSIGSDGPAAPFVEHWCEDPSREVRPESVQASPAVEWLRCWRLETGLQQILRARFSSRMVILPPPDDGRLVEAICEDDRFWQRGRREGPFVSRGSDGWELERGSYEDGLRNGVWVIGGTLCVRWQQGEPVGVVPCPAGSRLEDRGGIGHLATVVDRVRVAAGWPRLEDADGDELRLWHSAYVSSEMIRTTPPHSAMRWVRGDTSAARVLTWGLQVPERICPEMEHGGEVCSNSQPHHASWEEVFSELNSLDVWTVDFSETRVPLPGRQSAGGVGLYIERRIDGRVERRWYGSRPGLYYGDLSHQVRAIRNALGAVVGPRRSP